MPNDNFGQFADSPSAPATRCFVITPHATNDLITDTKAFYVGGAGDVTLRAIGDDSDVLLKNIAAGSIIDVRVRAVRAVGTTATFIVGLA
jgi:hypothetical protein